MTKAKTPEQRAADKAPRLPYTPDPDVLHLLDFEPVPRRHVPKNGWTPELQREFMARLATHGSVNQACVECGRDRSGLNKLYNSPQGGSFRGAWHAAIEFAEARKAAAVSEGPPPMDRAPTIDKRRTRPAILMPLSEEEEAIQRRVDEARDSISSKLRNARRLYLSEIAGCAGKRAAFEILTELPIDWEKAERMEPQLDEPWRRVSMRDADMLLTAENGWMGDMLHGPDKKAELRKALDAYRSEQGMPPIRWDNASGDKEKKHGE